MRQDARMAIDPARAAARLFAAAAVIVIAAIFLSTYGVHDFEWAVGSDTTQAVWRSNVVSELGLDGLPEPGPNVIDAGVDRPGLPLLMALQHGLFGVSPAEGAFGLPAAAGAGLALAAGAFAVGVLGRSPLVFGAVAVLVGASVNVDLFAAGYFDNLLAAVALVGAFALLLQPDRAWPGMIGGSALLAAGALYHWPVAAFAAGIVLATGLWTVVASRDAEGRAIAFRLVAGVGAGAAMGWILLWLAPGGLLSPELPDRGELLDKLARLYPVAVVPLVVVLVVGGLLALRGVRGTALAGRRLLIVWVITAAGGVSLIAAGRDIPAHRLVAFAIAVPILAGVALGALITVADRRWGVVAAIGAGALAVAVMAGAATLTLSSWLARPPAVDPAHVPGLRAVAATVDAAPSGRPVVLVVDAPGLPGHGVTPAIRRVRASIDPARVDDVHIFLGRPDDALAGRRTERPDDPSFTADADVVWPAVSPVLDDDPVVIVSGLFYKDVASVVAAHPDADRTHGLIVFRGSIGSASTETPPHGLESAIRTALLLFATVFLAGLGWAWSIVPSRTLVRAGMAPAIGLAALALAGFAADRLGLSVGSAEVSWGVLIAVALAGWVPFLVGWTRRGRSPST
jgi:hypothetical protein